MITWDRSASFYAHTSGRLFPGICAQVCPSTEPIFLCVCRHHCVWLQTFMKKIVMLVSELGNYGKGEEDLPVVAWENSGSVWEVRVSSSTGPAQPCRGQALCGPVPGRGSFWLDCCDHYGYTVCPGHEKHVGPWRSWDANCRMDDSQDLVTEAYIHSLAWQKEAIPGVAE